MTRWSNPFGFGPDAVGPNVWLQSFASEELTRVADVISFLGYTQFYVFVAILLALLWRRREAALLIIAVLLTSFASDAAKIVARQPRPSAVSERVTLLSRVQPDEGAETGGFPSGHVAATVAFVGGFVVLCRVRRALIPGVVWILAMAWSRLYLGRHFLVDVIGGLALGAVVVALVATALQLAEARGRAADYRRTGGRGVW